jgi:hypothetical protein
MYIYIYISIYQRDISQWDVYQWDTHTYVYIYIFIYIYIYIDICEINDQLLPTIYSRLALSRNGVSPS